MSVRRLLGIAVQIVFVVLGFRALFGGVRSAEGSARERPAARRESRLWGRAKRLAVAGVIILGTGAFLGALVVVSGVVSIKASSGHWSLTEWFLNFAKSRSVDTHTVLMDAPPLDDERLVLQGAGHYQFACRPCHGSPDLVQPVIASKMTPRPPDLRTSVREYHPEELFYIVKHGIKLTGMPAWPAQQRDDEIWAMVAFLRTLPSLDPASYERLVTGATARPDPGAPIADLAGPERVPPAIRSSCARCHGVDGLGRGLGAFPKLAGQRVAYLQASLQAYAGGKRHSGIMQPLAAGLEPDEIRDVAQYYSARAPEIGGASESSAPAHIERGKVIASEGIPDRLVPPCSDCHGPGAVRRNPRYPRLAGQYADYIVAQLALFKRGARGGSGYQHIMRQVASGLNEQDMRAVADYFASLSEELGESQR